MKKIVLITALMLAAICFASCVNNGPIIDGNVTPKPTAAVTEETPATTEKSDETQTQAPGSSDAPKDVVDAMGNIISGADHYIRYLYFKNLIVYEEELDTFFDGIAQNTYPYPIACAIDIVFRDEEGNEIARSRLQTRDGNYLLVLQPGENAILARILSDITLTDMDYTLEFDKETGIRPVDTGGGTYVR